MYILLSKSFVVFNSKKDDFSFAIAYSLLENKGLEDNKPGTS